MVEDERTYNAQLGARIVQARGDKSQPVFANELGVSKNTLLRYEKGQSVPDIVTIRKICDLRGLNLDWLVYNEGPMRPSDRPAGETQALVAVKAIASPEDAFDALGMAEGMGLLAEIYSSKDQINIRAINANLLAFADAVKTKARAVILEQTIQQMQAQMFQMQEQINELKQEVLRLRNENSDLKRELRSRGGGAEPSVATG